jgi:hypothetical protein
LLIAEPFEMVDQCADGEIRRIALPVVAILLACLEIDLGRDGDLIHLIAQALQACVDEPVVIRG